MTSIYYAWGCNVYGQVIAEEKHAPFICCPLRITPFLKDELATETPGFSISHSHILWKQGDLWSLNGFANSHFRQFQSCGQSALSVKSSEKRLIFHDGKEVGICSKGELRTLCLQYSDSKDEDRVEEIIDVALEDNGLLIVDGKGRLFDSGIQIPLPLSIKIKSVSVGKEHFLALTQEGVLLSWGSGMKGQLGHGVMNTVDAPMIVECLRGIEIVVVCCGGWHSVVLSASGDVYSWGWNDVGQLGFPSKSLRSDGVQWDDIIGHKDCQCSSVSSNDCSLSQDEADAKLKELKSNADKLVNQFRSLEPVNVQASPKLLDFWTEDVNVKSIACGDRHTLFLLENGSCWASGWNTYGQLGIGSTNSQDEPILIPILHPVKKIFAGAWNSVMLVETK